MIWKFSIIIFGFISCGQIEKAYCQNPGERHIFPSYSFKTHAGYIIPHNDLLKEVSKSVPFGFQADISWLNMSPKAWKQTNCFARTGFSLQHFQFNNPKELGSSSQLIGFLEPFLLRKNFFQWSFRFGLGATYLSKVHDEVSNPRNQFFSSPISFVVMAATSAKFVIHPNWRASLSAYYNHISNGGIKMPNKGMNFPTMAIGLDYLPFQEIFPVPPKPESGPFPWNMYLELGTSLKNTPEDWANFKGTFPVINVAGLLEKKISNVHAFSLGLEFTEDQYLRQYFLFKNQDFAHQLIGGLFGHAFHLGRFRISQQYGIYLFNQDPGKRFAYQRYGIHYELFKRISIGGTLKAHRHVADIFDFRLAYKMGSKKTGT
jgi:hypothetical protein